ncbi:SMC4 protein [Entamoeba histolytica HM-3:IMSS]|uniref:Structural maintenance of chromosomes protein n=6 Tax=Entamoeba histolytica TaxID=5759 RepID=C4M777_ENTH1|nr:SMC4 protein, putative [Entamoeba histolytica HM-1:IMSS]EMD43452.1 Hypothetical protein EHI5A_167200 [Entamoeba histolytica KU27]EMS15208.1 SMC4 protein [Entamoeba histolytica HM-3:IMSS]ENY65668.1 SMC4 protein, putative [Entamoeba histolytica HM-1:IMSS-A]GAT97375.1 smc4 protein putative [Entamoeba histolytica]EAL49361.1 SMC4 protein, putative [Entamoeba histolytica HM-1:IMSS]|eukprot:XP_654748.1 SMC4 protein, putative [Entamoeba histolytica HM-1:IMSS]
MEEVNQTSRMIIEKMTFYNFKSYYDKVELGPFHESFTAIVGANGCGKSNVIDGLLFVFGRRAKQIRQQKVADLIHKSALHPNCTEARVDVHLVNVDTDGSYLPNTRFTVTRIVFRDGTSKFMIDEVVCKFDAILEKMRSKGFDLLNNRFLILQGEVERIALMPTKSKNGEDGMLEFLEDIIGTSQYIEGIEKGTSELEKLNDEVHEKTNRFKIIERERNGILKEKENAISYLKEEYKMCGLKNNLNKLELKAVEEKEVEGKEEREKLEQKRKIIQDAKNEKLKEKTTKDKIIEEKERDIKKIEKEYEKQKGLINSAKKKKARAEEEKKQNEKAVLRNEKEIKEMEKKIKDEKEKIESKQRRYDQLSKTMEKDKEEIEKLKNDLEKQTSEVKEKTLPVKKEIENLMEKLKEPEERIEELRNENSRKEAEIEGKKEGLETIKNELKNISQTLNENERTIEEKVKEIEREEHLKKVVEEEERENEERRKGLEQEMRNLKEEIGEKRDLIQQLQQVCEVAENKKEIAKIIKVIQEEQIEGLKGRLGDLGSIEKKYDIAITTSCGMLDYIVVESIEGAQKISEICKERQLGRVSLIILEKMKVKPNWRNWKKIPKSERIVDLIDCEEWAREVFYFALRDTLVCENLTIAREVAFGETRQRVVTLNGELLDNVGSITGGGNVVLKGGMNKVALSKEEQKELQKLKEELEEKESQFEEIRKEVEAQRKKIEENAQKIKENTIKQEQLNDLKKKNKELKKRIEKGSLDVEAREREVTRICKEFEIKKQTSEEEIQKIEEQNKLLFEQLEQKQKELEKLEGLDMKIIKVNLQDINERNQRNTKEYNRIELEISGSTSKIDEWNSYLKEMNIHLEELKNRMEKDEIKIDETQMKLTKKELNEKNEELKKIEEEYGTLLKSIEELETEEDKIGEQIEEINGNNSELTEKRQRCEKEIRSIFKHIRELLHIAEIHEEDEYIENVLNHNETDNQMDEEKIRIIGISLKDVVDELKEINRKEVLAMIEDEKKKIENMIENVNLKIIATFIKVNKEYQEKWDVMNEAMKKQEDCKTTLEALKKKRFDEFMNGLTEISFKLKEMYYLLTQGGVAELELVDTLNPFTEGVVFSVRPPKKAWKNIANLSGGEKTLSSLALIFALHHYKPTPIYVMDEIDAALDFRNVSIIAHYIKERTKNAQFTIISLRPEMFELADRLMGVYKVKDVSCSVSFNPNAYNLNNN